MLSLSYASYHCYLYNKVYLFIFLLERHCTWQVMEYLPKEHPCWGLGRFQGTNPPFSFHVHLSTLFTYLRRAEACKRWAQMIVGADRTRWWSGYSCYLGSNNYMLSQLCLVFTVNTVWCSQHPREWLLILCHFIEVMTNLSVLDSARTSTASTCCWSGKSNSHCSGSSYSLSEIMAFSHPLGLQRRRILEIYFFGTADFLLFPMGQMLTALGRSDSIAVVQNQSWVSTRNTENVEDPFSPLQSPTDLKSFLLYGVLQDHRSHHQVRLHWLSTFSFHFRGKVLCKPS